MLSPDARAWAVKRFANQYRRWLAGDLTAFPQRLPLGTLTEKEFMGNQPQVRVWHAEWAQWPHQAQVEWDTYRWSTAGAHRLPTYLVLAAPADLAQCAGRLSDWETMVVRLQELQELTARSPAELVELQDILLGYSPKDWEAFIACVRYFQATPSCGLYIRQLPIPKVDTKWVGVHQADIARVMRLVHRMESTDFHEVTGVRVPEHLNHVMVKVLCPELRKELSGLSLLDLPVSSLHNWSLRPKSVLFVENLESGVALQDIPGVVALVGKGNAVLSLSDISWLSSARLFYWGDLDTHGLAIFGRLQARLPKLTPLLMDLPTLRAHEALWTTEAAPHPFMAELPSEQQEVFAFLARPENLGVRLEQERIPWATAWAVIEEALST